MNLRIFSSLICLVLVLSLAANSGGVAAPLLLSGNHAEVKQRTSAFDPPKAYPNGSTWQIQRVGYTSSAQTDKGYTSLALDAAGRPHIGFNGYGTSLDYAYWDGSTWQVQYIDWDDNVGAYASLALDANERPHISYFDWTNYDLKYAYWDGVAWQVQTIDSAGNVGHFTSLALDAAGQPYISYFDSTNSDLKYAHWDGNAWQVQIVDSDGDVGCYTSLALDADERPHISYFDNTNHDLKYAHWDGSAWQIQTVDSAGDVGHYTSLALDAAGQPHISYYDWTNSNLIYAHWDGNAWQIQIVDSDGGVGQYDSLALDAAGQPHISYWDATNGDLKYAHWDGNAWQVQIVDSAGIVGYYTSLALDADGQPHISYLLSEHFRSFPKYAYLPPPTLDLISNASPDPVPAGGELIYTFTYHNDLSFETTNTTLELTLSPELSFLSANPPPDSSSDVYTWHIGALGQGASGMVVVTTSVAAWAPNNALLESQVVLSSAQTVPNQQAVQTSVSAPLPDLSSSIKTVSPLDWTAGGGVLRYTIAYHNSGTGGAGNMTVVDTIPLHTTYLPNSADYGGVYAGGAVTWQIPLVKPGEEGELSFSVQVDKPLAVGTSIQNSAAISSDQTALFHTNQVANTVLRGLTIEDSTTKEGDSGTAQINFRVSLSSASDQVVSVDFTTQDSTAAAGSDYTAASGQVTFALGETSHSISVPVMGDEVAEPDEKFTIKLSNSVNAAFERGTAVGTILDDDFKFLSLPLVLRPPNPPMLSAISNPDKNGAYAVQWSAVGQAQTYLLEEATNSDFSDTVEVYQGALTSFNAADKGPTRYDYRVKALAAANQHSAWSNVQPVDVNWELEGNGDLAAANGPLLSGLEYYGLHNDQDDYFKVYLSGNGVIAAQLNSQLDAKDDNSNYVVQLQIKDSSGNLLDYAVGPNVGLEYTVAAGWYYVRVFTVPEYVDAGKQYTLMVTFP